MARMVEPEKYEARRRTIIDAAILCFAREGFDRTSTAKICAEAGMSPGNLFYYFASKDEIIEAIVREDRRETLEYFEELNAGADQVQGIRNFITASLEVASNPTRARMMIEITAAALYNGKITQLAQTADVEIKAGLADLVRKAIERGQIRPPHSPEQVATWLVVLIDGVFARLTVDPEFDPMKEEPMLQKIVSDLLGINKET